MISTVRQGRLLFVAAAVSVPLALAVTTASAQQDIGEQLASAIKQGSVALDLRYRYELVDEQGFDNAANASLLRTRLTLKSGPVGPLSALLEIDDVSSIGTDDYNSTENGKIQYPVIADPEGIAFN